jgi:hypothetical protein
MAMKPEVRERIRGEMTALLQAWKASGEPRVVFAHRHGISLPKFDYWQRQLQLTRPRRRRAASGFAEVQMVPVPVTPVAGVLELTLATGDRLVVHTDASLPLVRTVLTALRARC